MDRITINSDVVGGQPCIRDLRISISIIVRLVATGKGSKEIIEDYPELEFGFWTNIGLCSF